MAKRQNRRNTRSNSNGKKKMPKRTSNSAGQTVPKAAPVLVDMEITSYWPRRIFKCRRKQDGKIVCDKRRITDWPILTVQECINEVVRQHTWRCSQRGVDPNSLDQIEAVNLDESDPKRITGLVTPEIPAGNGKHKFVASQFDFEPQFALRTSTDSAAHFEAKEASKTSERNENKVSAAEAFASA